MSIVSALMILLFVSMHACDARHSPGSRIHNKGMIHDETKLNHKMDINSSLASSENSKETFSKDTSLSKSTLGESQSFIQMQGLERRERSMKEATAETHETEEPSDEHEGIEDAVVMDYVTPHRKSPIHNNHH